MPTPPPNRRTVLRMGAALLTAAGVGALGIGARIQPARRLRPPARPDDAERPERTAGGARVVVVGGGLSGIAAATALAERGYAVTLLEAASHLGGKIGGWSIEALGERFPVEHGFHGFFKQYYNLRELLAAAGALDDLAPSDGYPVVFADRPPERFGKTTSIFPLNLLSVIDQSASLRFTDFARPSEGLLELLRYDPERSFAAFDGMDFLSFAQANDIPAPMVDTVLRPFGDTTLNRCERLSAAEALRFFHFYFLGNPEGLGFDILTRDVMAAVVDRLEARMRALGVEIRVGAPATELRMRDGRVVGVGLGGRPAGVSVACGADGAPSPCTRRTGLRVDAVGAGWAEVSDPVHGTAFVARRDGQLVALSGACTHKGCPVRPDPGTGGFRCPCHGGRYAADGAVTGGPPPRALDAIPVGVLDGEIALGDASAPPDALAADWVVVACEVRGLQKLLAASGHCGSDALAAQVRALGESDPYVVLRLWLDRPVDAARDAFYTVSGFRYTDSLAVYSHFQEPFAAWAARTGGAVVELHAYAIAPEDRATPEELTAALLDEMRQLLPELREARVLHHEIQVQDDFTRFAPGDWATRPTTRTPVPNLLLAGDHVKIDIPAFLMEAAVVSGRLAANAVLSADGLREVPIAMVAPRGPLAGG